MAAVRTWLWWFALGGLALTGCATIEPETKARERAPENKAADSPAVRTEADKTAELMSDIRASMRNVEVKNTPVDDEASLMVAELFDENRDLRAKLAARDRQIEGLQQELAEALAALDVARVEAIGKVAAQPAAPVEANVAVEDIARVRVLDVNRDMQVAVISGGIRAGMKPGMRFYVLREERMIGQLKLIDVRDDIAGGLIEQVEKDEFPEKGDRIILSSKQDG